MDNRRRIVAVIPADSARGGGAAVSSGADFADLSPEEIRQVQLVLIDRGFSLEADGRLGARTRNALIQFQRREGLQATGRIDSSTVTSLGVSIRSNQQPSTTGQDGGSQQSPRGSGGAQSNPPQNSPMGPGDRPGASQPGASQQGGQTSNQPQSATPTTGQGQGSGSNTQANPGSSGAGKPAAQPGSSSGGSPSGAGSSSGSGSSSGGSSGGGQ